MCKYIQLHRKMMSPWSKSHLIEITDQHMQASTVYYSENTLYNRNGFGIYGYCTNRFVVTCGCYESRDCPRDIKTGLIWNMSLNFVLHMQCCRMWMTTWSTQTVPTLQRLESFGFFIFIFLGVILVFLLCLTLRMIWLLKLPLVLWLIIIDFLSNNNFESHLILKVIQERYKNNL